MPDVIIAGGGFAGLAAALFLARRGHEVVVVERDGPPEGGAADDDASGWQRPGAPQSRQTHALLGKARRVLAEEAPDVIDALLARGVRQAPVMLGPWQLDGEQFLMSRRLVAEAVLRRVVEREPGVVVLRDAVTGVQSSGRAAVPIVTGVRLDSGGVLDAPLVVDAGGRRSALPDWLAAIGARPTSDETQECGFFYATRYFRTAPGHSTPTTRIPASVALDYATVLAAGADNDTFSITTTLSTQDPVRSRISDPDLFMRFIAMVPWSASWIETGEPLGGVSTMSRIENRRRVLVDGDGPVAGGIIALGDAALHTNPTLGRGISMALWHAQHLAEVAGSAASDPVSFTQHFHDWTMAHLGVWFDTQVSADAASIQRLEAGLRGERLPLPTDPASTMLAAAFACAGHNELVGRAVARVVHLLAPPTTAFSDPEVVSAIQTHLATTPRLDRGPDIPTRAEFEAMAAR